ncbi:MAG: hypothetical protein ACI8S6_001805 [Myxococcota bacterium]|jgi:hypothetical protein
MRLRLVLSLAAVLLFALWLARPAPEEAPAEPVAQTDTRSERQPRIRRPLSLHPRPAAEAEPADTGEPDAAVAAAEDTGAEMLPPPLVRVILVDTDGTPIEDGMVFSSDCGIWRSINFEGFAEFYTPEGSCLFQGRRRDGLLWGRSEWLEVDLLAGDEVELELVVPTERTGGLGVQIQAHEEGIEVVRVWPGTPASEMGLETGDIITAVDGLPASALTMDEFIEVMTGPVGTDVEFELSYFGDTGLLMDSMTLTRAWLNN